MRTRTFMPARATVVPAAIAVFLLVAGCTNPNVTVENYRAIEEGMTHSQVDAILGPPNRHKKDDWIWEGKYGDIRIEFEEGVVDDKEWDDKGS
jgi:hypothetical protein